MELYHLNHFTSRGHAAAKNWASSTKSLLINFPFVDISLETSSAISAKDKNSVGGLAASGDCGMNSSGTLDFIYNEKSKR